MDKQYVRAFLDEFEGNRYPEGFTARFEAMEHMAYKPGAETLLVRDKESGRLLIAKCYAQGDALCGAGEADILKELDHPCLPKYIDEYTSDDMRCVVREYISGTPLDAYVAEHTLSRQEILHIGQQLCDVLAYLHSHTPPIIHRDLKPQNVIVDENKNLKLIDFGISRIYDETAEQDTAAFGTKHFAAPEQYGFSQTDCRADIFSLGVLLGWLCTGEVKLKNILDGVEDRQLKRVIRKCAAFAPASRYSSAEKVKRKLRGLGRQKRLVRLLVLVLTGAVFLYAGFAVGRYTDWLQPPPKGVSFSEPLVEQAVRLTLDIPDDQPVQEKDLLSMTEIYIYGNQVAADHSAFEQLGSHMAANDGFLRNGGVVSLDDLAMMKNLRGVNIALQDISDLSALSGLEALEQLDLRHNPVGDLSPLAGLRDLQNVCLYDTRVTDISPLKDCVQLNGIDLGKTPISSIFGFGGIASLNYLGLADTPLATLAGIEEYGSLKQINVTSVADNDLRPLLALPYLQDVSLGDNLYTLAQSDLAEAAFTITQLSS